MANNGKKLDGFSEAWFLQKGYTKNPDNSWSPPPFKNPLAPKDYLPHEYPTDLVPKMKVNDAPNVQIKPCTEWFIRNYNVPSKKNSRQNFVRNGKQISIPSKNHAEYVKMTAMQYATFGKEFLRAVEYYKLLYPLHVEFGFVRNSRHRFDYCNAAQTCEDIMVDNGWLPDDSAEYLLPSFKPYEYNKEEFGVHIKLLLK